MGETVNLRGGGNRDELRMWVFCGTDHHLATLGIAATARREAIYLAQRFSDHAPLIVDYDLKL